MRTYSFSGKPQIRQHSSVRVCCIVIKTLGLTWCWFLLRSEREKSCPSVATFYSGAFQSASATGSVNHFTHLLVEQHLCLVLQSRYVPSNFGQEVCKNSTFSNWKCRERTGRMWWSWLEFGPYTRDNARFSMLLFWSAWGKLGDFYR